MSAFRSPLIVENPDGLPYILYLPLRYDSDLLGRTLTVPVGFITDLASIPRVLWRVLPKSGKYDRPGVIHDYLYKTNGVTRKEADDVLLEAMKVTNVPTWQRNIIYSGVLVGGWVAWNRYRKLDSL